MGGKNICKMLSVNVNCDSGMQGDCMTVDRVLLRLITLTLCQVVNRM